MQEGSHNAIIIGFIANAGVNAAEARVRAAVPIARLIYLEPDVARTGS